MTSCVVTGATGCLGLHVTQRLIKEGFAVIALGRNVSLGKIISDMGAQFVALDLMDKNRLKEVSKDADVIFHCAALSSPWGRYQDFYQANVVGTQHVIEATPRDARLVHVSSPSIYFDFTERHNIKEADPLPKKPANHYVHTKRLAESLIDKAFQEKNLEVITLRPRAIFGPYDRSIFPRLLNAVKNGVLPLVGTGENVIDITYVENVVDSLMLAATAERRYCGKKYNITNNEPQKLVTIITALFNALQKPLKMKTIPYPLAKAIAFCLESFYRLPMLSAYEPRITAYNAGVLALGQTLNIDAAMHDLGYRPKVTIAEGMERFANGYVLS